MGKPGVSAIGAELARPFLEDYCRRWHLPLHVDGIEEVAWIGAFYHGGLRAVAGVREIGPDFPDDRYIFGFYGDGSAVQNVAMVAVGRALMALPYGLLGSVHLANRKMLRVAVRHGFAINRISPEDRCAVVYRPPLRRGKEVA